MWQSACGPPRERAGSRLPSSRSASRARSPRARTPSSSHSWQTCRRRGLRASRRPTRRPDLGPFVLVSLMLVGIWALTGMGYFWPVWPIAGWGISFVAPGRLRGPCRRRSSSRGCSTARWPSSAAAGPGSGEPPRSSWRRSARRWWSAGGGSEPLEETAAAAEGGRVEAQRLRHPRGGPGRGARGRRARAPRPDRPAREQRGRPVPHAGRGHHAEGLPNGDPAERRGHLADDPRGRDAGDDSGRRAAARS